VLVWLILLLIFTRDSCTGRYCWERLLAMGILSVRLSVRLSVWGVTTRYRIKPRWDKDSGFSPYGSVGVSDDVKWCRWVRRFPSNEGIKEGYRHKNRSFTTIGSSMLQIDTDLLLIITTCYTMRCGKHTANVYTAQTAYIGSSSSGNKERGKENGAIPCAEWTTNSIARGDATANRRKWVTDSTVGNPVNRLYTPTVPSEVPIARNTHRYMEVNEVTVRVDWKWRTWNGRTRYISFENRLHYNAVCNSFQNNGRIQVTAAK